MWDNNDSGLFCHTGILFIYNEFIIAGYLQQILKFGSTTANTHIWA